MTKRELLLKIYRAICELEDHEEGGYRIIGFRSPEEDEIKEINAGVAEFMGVPSSEGVLDYFRSAEALGTITPSGATFEEWYRDDLGHYAVRLDMPNELHAMEPYAITREMGRLSTIIQIVDYIREV